VCVVCVCGVCVCVCVGCVCVGGCFLINKPQQLGGLCPSWAAAPQE